VDAGVDTIEHGKLGTRADFDMMRQHGTWLVTNNAIGFHPDGIEKGDAHTPEIMAKLNRAREATPAMMRDMLDSGVSWALGTDSMHGLLWYEAAKTVEWGATPEQALAAVTSKAAQAIGRLDSIGTLQPGKLADVISVRGDPLHDITALQHVGLVIERRPAFRSFVGDVTIPSQP
jgi:imidazolonepropionase-like amidohydrolase